MGSKFFAAVAAAVIARQVSSQGHVNEMRACCRDVPLKVGYFSEELPPYQYYDPGTKVRSGGLVDLGEMIVQGSKRAREPPFSRAKLAKIRETSAAGAPECESERSAGDCRERGLREREKRRVRLVDHARRLLWVSLAFLERQSTSP